MQMIRLMTTLTKESECADQSSSFFFFLLINLTFCHQSGPLLSQEPTPQPFAANQEAKPENLKLNPDQTKSVQTILNMVEEMPKYPG